MIKSAVISGASGYVGSNLCRKLLSEGTRVHALVLPGSEGQLKNMRVKITRPDKISGDPSPGQPEIHVPDGSVETLTDIIQRADPEIVFHLASVFIHSHKPGDINNLVTSNVLFGTRLAEAMVNAGVKRLVNTGTAWQHFMSESYNPVDLYAATKQAFEDILEYYIRAKGMQVTTLKLFDTYGPDDPRPKIINLLRKTADTGVPLKMSPGYQKLDLVHVDDVVYAFTRAGEELISSTHGLHRKYGVSSGNPVTLRELVERLEKIWRKTIPVNWGALDYREREVMEPWRGFEPFPFDRPLITLEDNKF
jgi:nucleoside-diphosphate-sugar epimerase